MILARNCPQQTSANKNAMDAKTKGQKLLSLDRINWISIFPSLFSPKEHLPFCVLTVFNEPKFSWSLCFFPEKIPGIHMNPLQKHQADNTQKGLGLRFGAMALSPSGTSRPGATGPTSVVPEAQTPGEAWCLWNPWVGWVIWVFP